MEAVYIIWEWPSRRPKQFPPPFLFLPSRWFAFLPPQPGHTHTHTPKRLCVRIDKSTTPLSACLSLLSLQWRENTPEGFPSAATSSNDTQHTHTQFPWILSFSFSFFLFLPRPLYSEDSFPFDRHTQQLTDEQVIDVATFQFTYAEISSPSCFRPAQHQYVTFNICGNESAVPLRRQTAQRSANNPTKATAYTHALPFKYERTLMTTRSTWR